MTMKHVWETSPEPTGSMQIAATPKRRGRPRKYPDNAARQAAYNKRKKDPVKIKLIKRIHGVRHIRMIDSAEMLRLSIRELREIQRGLRNKSI